MTQDAKPNEVVQPWRTLLYEFTQDTTLHGMRYITLETWYTLRRVLWALAVLTAFALFVYINVQNVITYRNYPKSVNVEVDQEPEMDFPAVTICNYNKHKLSSLVELGLFENVMENYGNLEPSDSECHDTFTYQFYTGACPKVVDEFYYYNISELACEKLCTGIHSLVCSAIRYDRTEKFCEITSSVLTSEDMDLDCSADIEYYRRNRCKVIPHIRCSFESSSTDTICPELSNDEESAVTREDWVRVTAAANTPSVDHTIRNGRGHYMFLKKTSLREGYMATLQTDFLYLDDTCVELYYAFIGESNDTTLKLEVRDENLKVHIIAQVYRTGTEIEWTRLYKRLPDGYHQIMVIGVRPEDLAASGVAIDDVIITSCSTFRHNCKFESNGRWFQGSLNQTIKGTPCYAWSSLGIDLSGGWTLPDETIEDAGSSCRNPGGDISPWCYIDYAYNYEFCHVDYCACAHDQFMCDDGSCIPGVYICDGTADCPDNSDESDRDVCVSREFLCEFEDTYLCGYTKDGIGLVWMAMQGVDMNDGIGPTIDSYGSVLGGYVYADARFGSEGQETYLYSVTSDFKDGDCLAFWLYFKVTQYSEHAKIRVLLQNSSHLNANPIEWYTVEADVSDTVQWTRHVVPVPPGNYRAVFAFRMGHPFECAAAIDGVKDIPCASADEVTGSQDVSSKEPVPVASLTCDFSPSNMCGYSDFGLHSKATWAFIDIQSVHKLLSPESGGISNSPCSAEFYFNAGDIFSPYHPNNYASYLTDCLARIVAPANSEVVITFLVFDVEYGGDCGYDAVEIRIGSLDNAPTHTLCNTIQDTTGHLNIAQSTYNLSAEEIFITLRTDASVERVGFHAKYEIHSRDTRGYALVLNNDATPTDQKSWYSFYTPTLQVAETSCLGFDTILMGQTDFQVQLAWSEKRTIFATDGTITGHNKVYVNIPAGIYQVKFHFEFIGSRGVKGNLYDVTLENALCQNAHMSGSLTCDFSDVEQCGYLDVSRGPLHWLRDEHSGLIILNFQNTQEFPTFVSPLVTHHSDMCLMLILNADGINNDWRLFVSIHAPEDIDTPPDYLTYFNKTTTGMAKVTLPPGSYRVLFTSNDAYDSVSVQSVTVQEGACAGGEGLNLGCKDECPLGVVNTDGLANSDIDLETLNQVNPYQEMSPPARPPSTTRRAITETVNVYDFYVNTAHQQEDFIYRCKYDGEDCTGNGFNRSITDLGVCYVFNVGPEIRQSTNPGAQYGLSLTLNIEQYEHTVGATQDAGVKVHLHNQRDIPNARDVGVSVSLSSHTFLAVTNVRAESLGPPHGDCGERELPWYPEFAYSHGRCTKECELRGLIEMCDCITYYMPVSRGDRYCSVTEEFRCVNGFFANQSSIKDSCPPCPKECNSVTYTANPSVASLSSQGVSNILNEYDEDISHQYLFALELRQRMDPDLFATTFGAMENVSSAIRQYVSYAKHLTEDKLTSEFSLIQDSLKAFQEEIFLKDYNNVYGDISIYQKDYTSAYAWKHKARISLMNEATEKLITFHETFYSRSKSSNDPTFSLLAELIRKAFSDLTYDKPRASGAFDVKYLPENIFESKSAENVCKSALKLNITAVLSHLQSLAATTMADIDQVFTEFDYNGFIDDMIKFVKNFEKCTSYYSSYLDSMASLGNDFYSTAKRNISFGDSFIFEEESELLEEFDGWFHETIQNAFRDDHIAMTAVTRQFSLRYQAKLLMDLKNFRDTMTQSYDTAMKEFITEMKTLMKTLYLQTLDQFITGTYYYGSGKDFKEIGSSMVIWRIPTSDLLSENSVTLKYSVEETWLVWPINMNLDTFRAKQAPLVLDIITKEFFGNLLSELSNIDEEFQARYDAIESAFSELKAILIDYESKTGIDDRFILDNFLSLDVYYGELTYEFIQQTKAYPLDKFFSDMGGFMGLLLGASVMTICELLDLIIYNCCRKWRNSRVVSDKNTTA